MKRIFLFVFSCFVISVAVAQTITINNFPKDLEGIHMNLKMDFSQALICGMSEKEFSEFEKDWKKDKSTIIRNFKSGANFTLGNSYGVGDYKDARYTVKIIVNTITEEGYFICDVDILDENKKVVFHLDYLTGGKEPSFSIGTKLARMKVWATLTGKSLGSILKSELSKK